MKIFYDIVDYIKRDGCNVNIYTDKHNVEGSNASFVETPQLAVNIAIKNRTLEDIVMLLIHEYGHYLQYVEQQYLAEYRKAMELRDRLEDGEVLTPRDIDFAREFNCHLEYDCDLRTIEMIDFFNVSHLRSPQEHIRYANAYNRHIAWSIGCPKRPGSRKFLLNHPDLRDVLFPNGAKVYKISEALEPCSSEHQSLIDDFAQSKGIYSSED